MIVKGKNQHVMPCNDLWCVVDEEDRMIAKQFLTIEEALAHANEMATMSEGDVLIHSTSAAPGAISSVALPQREVRQSPGIVPPLEDTASPLAWSLDDIFESEL